LTESAPRGTDVAEIREHLLATAGVVSVHDVHVWAITSGPPVFTAHVVVEPEVLARETGELPHPLAACLRDHSARPPPTVRPGPSRTSPTPTREAAALGSTATGAAQDAPAQQQGAQRSRAGADGERGARRVDSGRRERGCRRNDEPDRLGCDAEAVGEAVAH